MSYCRWSTNDFRCDLYVYEDSFNRIQMHIAGRRHTIPDDLMPPSINYDDPDWSNLWPVRSKVVTELMKQYPNEPIGGPYDGLSIYFDGADEAAEWIEQKLDPLGIYNYPDTLIAELRGELND